jgi:hypothetical protein
VAKNIGQFIRAHRITVVAILSSLAIGVAIGFVATAAYHLQTTALIVFAVVVAIASWLGSGTDILGLLRDMYKDWKSEQSVPLLAFKGYSKGREVENVGGKDRYNYTYFAIVRKISGEGYANHCEGFLTVANTKISNAPTVWLHASVRRYSIGGRMDLRLFTVNAEEQIIFPSANIEQGFAPNPKQYDKFIDKDITIELYADYGKTPSPETKKIRKIIEEAVEETEE